MNRGLSFSTRGSALNPTFSPARRPVLEMKNFHKNFSELEIAGKAAYPISKMMKKWHGFEPKPPRPLQTATQCTGAPNRYCVNESKVKRKNKWYRMYKKRPRWLINVVERIRKWVEKTVISVRLSQTTAKQILNRLKETYELLRKKPEEQAQKSGKYSYSH